MACKIWPVVWQFLLCTDLRSRIDKLIAMVSRAVLTCLGALGPPG